MAPDPARLPRPTRRDRIRPSCAITLLVGALLLTACGSSTTAAPPSAGPQDAAAATPEDRSVTTAPSGAAASPDPGGPATPRPSLRPAPVLRPPAYASRVVVATLRIDLPVVSGDLQPPPSYPLCDVASYVTRFSQPYETGVTYLSAHAQEGMFLPLLEASQRRDGRELLGERVDVYTDDGMRYGYRIESVHRHATDYAVLEQLDLAARTLILQTSEGPFGTAEKLQIVAALEEETPADVGDAAPVPQPRDCRPSQLRDEDPVAP